MGGGPRGVAGENRRSVPHPQAAVPEEHLWVVYNHACRRTGTAVCTHAARACVIMMMQLDDGRQAAWLLLQNWRPPSLPIITHTTTNDQRLGFILFFAVQKKFM